MYIITRTCEAARYSGDVPYINYTSGAIESLKQARKMYANLLRLTCELAQPCNVNLELSEGKTVIRKHTVCIPYFKPATGREPIVERERNTVLVEGNKFPTAKVFYNDKVHEVIGLYEGYGDSDDKRFLFGNEYGPTHLVISDSRHNAWEAMIDASHTVEDTDDLLNDDGDLQDIYTYQSNFSGSGIVETLYLWCVEWDNAAKEWGQCRGA